LVLSGDACGAFDEVMVFDGWLDDEQLIAAAGLDRVAAYLQEQMPPPGAPRGATVGRQMSYVEPATGDTVTVTVDETGRVYNPANMPELPETPHTKWARPLAGGPVKALMVMPGAFYDEVRTLLREGVELWQRLDMDCDITDRFDPALEAKGYEVIVVTHQGHAGVWQGWTDLEEALRNWIVTRVRAGKSGLVLTYPLKLDGKLKALLKERVASDCILRGFPVTAMHKAVSGRYDPVYELPDDWFETREHLADKVVEVYAANRFRVVKLNYVMGAGWGLQAGLTPDTAINSAATLPQYDYWQALAARAVLFAASRDTGATIVSLTVEPELWTAAIDGDAATLWYRARDLWGREYAAGVLPVTGRAVRIPAVAVPPRAIVDVVLKDGRGRVLDWFSQVVRLVPGVRIDGIVLDRNAYSVGDRVNGTVQLTTPAGAEYRLQVYLADHEGRRIRRVEKTVRGGAAAAGFELILPESGDSLLMRIDAVLRRGERIVAERSADCPLHRTRFEGFFAGMSGVPHNRAVDRMRRRMFRDRYGVNMTQHNGDHTYAMAARDNLSHYEAISHLDYPRDEKSFKPWIEKWDDFFPDRLICDLDKVQPYRPLFYSLGEEHYLLLSGSRHPLAVERFQEWLRGRYGTLERLNQVWNAEFSAWDQIPMVKPEIVDVMKLDFGVQSFESRRFMEHLFARKHADLAAYVRKVDAHAAVGIHVGWDLWMGRGYDYWLLSRGMESMIGYGGVQNQYIRSFFENYYGSWWHYALGSHDDARWHPWYMLLSGARGFMWYTQAPQLWGATTGDLHPSSDWQAAAPEFTAAARAGDLLARTDYVQDQVAIHYSQDSMQAGVGPALSWLHNSFVNLLFDGGVPFHFISQEELAQGKARGVPLLVLPSSISLSPGEVAAIRDYVRQGGVVWADAVPGTHDQFGRRLPQSQMAGLFAELEERTLAGGRSLRVSRDGRIVLGAPGNYLYARNVGEHRPVQELLDAVVDLAGVQRVGRVLDAADSGAANGVWLAGYRRGAQRYLVAGKDYQVVDRKPALVDIAFDGPAHVYEARSGRYLGHCRTVRDTLEPTRGKLYALLPYRVRGLRARTGWWPRRAIPGRDLVVRVKLLTTGSVGPDDLHLLRVAVTGPDGTELTALRRLAPIRGGAGDVRLPLAYNDRAGRYTIRMHDSATGVSQKLAFSY